MGANYWGNENDNPSRGYKNSVCEQKGTTGHKFDNIPHSISHPYKIEKKGVKILPGSSAQLKWRQRWSFQSTAGRGYRHDASTRLARSTTRSGLRRLGRKITIKNQHTPIVYIKNFTRVTGRLNQSGHESCVGRLKLSPLRNSGPSSLLHHPQRKK